MNQTVIDDRYIRLSAGIKRSCNYLLMGIQMDDKVELQFVNTALMSQLFEFDLVIRNAPSGVQMGFNLTALMHVL